MQAKDFPGRENGTSNGRAARRAISTAASPAAAHGGRKRVMPEARKVGGWEGEKKHFKPSYLLTFLPSIIFCDLCVLCGKKSSSFRRAFGNALKPV
jgi:hypothetical protein